MKKSKYIIQFRIRGRKRWSDYTQVTSVDKMYKIISNIQDKEPKNSDWEYRAIRREIKEEVVWP